MKNFPVFIKYNHNIRHQEMTIKIYITPYIDKKHPYNGIKKVILNIVSNMIILMKVFY
ncbi:hypothetical protein [Oceanobacillus locisalsi]|uniref:Uncharacterized protein n=1 Tax=Oceanobacillus locisalsi TaxID=546107 RepID=A0ABW3NNH0_9BACI